MARCYVRYFKKQKPIYVDLETDEILAETENVAQRLVNGESNGVTDDEVDEDDTLSNEEDVKDDINKENHQNILSYTFRNTSLRRHTLDNNVKKSTATEKFKCSHCPKKIETKRGLHLHMIRRHKIKGIQSPKETVADHLSRSVNEDPNREKRNFCSLCSASFATKSQLLAHMRTHANKSKPFKCSSCEKTFSLMSQLSVHVQTHANETTFQCPVCNVIYNNVKTLIIHMSSHTMQISSSADTVQNDVNDPINPEKPFKCPVCPRDFKKKRDLILHSKRHSGNTKSLVCVICTKKFSSERSLADHMRTHTGERPFKCQYCDLAFKQQGHAKVHERLHTGEKPYVCPGCGLCFRQNSHLNQHKRNVCFKKV